MNFSEFKKLLGADPWNRDPQTLRARRSEPRFETAAQDAEAFERRLEGAFRVPVDDALLDRVLEIPGRSRHGRLPRWLAMAASIVLVAGLGSVVWWQSAQPGTIEEYVARHHAHDGEVLLSRAGEQADPRRFARIMASLDVDAQDALAARIRFVKYCPTMDGRGAHMIVDSAQGPVQVIYMPATRITATQAFQFDGMHAHLLGLEKGSAVIIGREDQAVGDMDEFLRGSLLPLGGA